MTVVMVAVVRYRCKQVWAAIGLIWPKSGDTRMLVGLCKLRIISRMYRILQQGVRFLVMTGLLILTPLTGHTADSRNLFEAGVPVSGQQQAERTAAMRQALSAVLVRVTGQRELLATDRARPLLDDASRYVQQYRYFTLPDSTPPRLMLRVRFDGDAIRQALREQGIAYWGDTERPDTLVWLAVEERGRRYIVSAQDETVVHGQVQQAARQRGVPLLFPLMDLQDQAQVRFSDIQGGFFDRVLEASERYNPQAILIGRLNLSPSGSWVARWNLRIAGNTTSWSDTDSQLAGVARAGIDNVADNLASRLAVTDSGMIGNRVDITVDDINSLADYARVTEYLGSLTAVRQLQVVQVAGSSVDYALQLNGTQQGLKQTIVIGTVLEPVASESPGSYRVRQ